MTRQRHILIQLIALGVVTLCASVTAAAELVAEQITASNAKQHIQSGPDAAGGLGDWALSNGTLCAIVSDISHESDLSAQGGALVDLGYCDRADDQFVVTQDLLDGSPARPIDMQQIGARLGSNQAAIISTGGHGGLVQETQLSLSPDQPSQLRISKRIQRRHDDAPSFRLLAPILFNYYSMETFLLSSTNPERSTGFSQIGFSDQGLSAFADAARALDTIVALGAVDSEVPVAYGWQLRSASKTTANGEKLSLPIFAAADAGASAFLILNDPFFVGDSTKLGITHMLQIALMSLEVGEVLEVEEILYVGRRSDVASITDQLYSDAPLHSGRVSDPSAVVQVKHKSKTGTWAPFSFVRPEQQGRYQLRLPPGDYQFTAIAAAEATVSATASVTVAATTLPTLKLPTTAVLELPQGNAMRLVFRGINGTADPDLQNTLTGYGVSVAGETIHPPRVPMLFLAGIESDRDELSLPAGDYRVYATRGIEYSLTESQISLKPGQRLRLEIDAPVHVVPTPGYIATDLHVHSGPSMDNGFSPRERVRTFVAEHGEVMVATEHETLFDFTPLIRSMGVEHQIATVTGTEMTGQVRTGRMPHTAGHANFFPLRPDPTAFRRGVPANEDRRLREVLYSVRRTAPTVLAQLNHARANDEILKRLNDPTELIDDGAYFDHMGPAAYPFNPNEALSSGPNRTLIEPDPITGVRDIDFDALEILNGSHDYSPTRRKTLLADWLSLLLQGERLTGTANSDSHGKSQQVALPRNMVAMASDSIADFDEALFIEAIRAGHSYGTTGPLMELSLSGTQMGGTFAGANATLSGRVRTASWVPADELRVLVNGEVMHTEAISTTGTFAFPLEFQADSFVLIEVEAEPTEPYQIIFPGHRPYAFSNPIFVDANGDGRWEPPGLRQTR